MLTGYRPIFYTTNNLSEGNKLIFEIGKTINLCTGRGELVVSLVFGHMWDITQYNKESLELEFFLMNLPLDYSSLCSKMVSVENVKHLYMPSKAYGIYMCWLSIRTHTVGRHCNHRVKRLVHINVMGRIMSLRHAVALKLILKTRWEESVSNGTLLL